MRASRILATRPERAIVALAQLCEERKEVDPPHPSPPPTIFIPPRLSPIPPQTPYTVGSNSDAKGLPSPEQIASSQPQHSGPGVQIHVPSRSPPEHMAPKRSEWTSPPPPEAPPADHTSFEDRLGLSLELATSSTDAREREEAYTSSSSNSEALSDDESRSDVEDIRSVHSFTEGSSPSGPSFYRPPWQDSAVRTAPVPRGYNAEVIGGIGSRGRYPSRVGDKDSDTHHAVYLGQGHDAVASAYRAEASRRSTSGPPRTSHRLSWPSMMPIALVTPLPPSPSGSESPVKSYSPESSTVFYETGSRHPPVLYPSRSGCHSPIFPLQQQHYHLGLVGAASGDPSDRQSPIGISHSSGQSSAGPDTPTPYYSRPAHHHSHSNATITAPTPRANISHFAQNVTHSSSSSPSPTGSCPQSPPPPNIPQDQHILSPRDNPNSPLASTSYGSDSPTPSSTSYATSLSPSPPSSSSRDDFDHQILSASPSMTEDVLSKLLKSVQHNPNLTAQVNGDGTSVSKSRGDNSFHGQ
jgi:terminal uridylyltransferase